MGTDEEPPREADRPGLLARAAQRLSPDAFSPAVREQRRRAALGREGRIAEDVVSLVEACGPVWEALAEKGLPQDLTLRQLRHLEHLLDDLGPGERPRSRRALTVSLAVTEPGHVDVVRALVPGGGEALACDAYRYVVLRPPLGAAEPFLVALDRGVASDGLGDGMGDGMGHALGDGLGDGVVAVVLLAPTFLRYEQEMGTVNPLAVQALEAVTRADLDAVLETRRALDEA